MLDEAGDDDDKANLYGNVVRCRTSLHTTHKAYLRFRHSCLKLFVLAEEITCVTTCKECCCLKDMLGLLKRRCCFSRAECIFFSK